MPRFFFELVCVCVCQFFNTLHSYGQLILMPWSYTDILPPDYNRMFDLAMRVGIAKEIPKGPGVGGQ